MGIDKKTILVTGGTGSFGKKFIRTILDRYNPARVIVFSRDELKQYDMQKNFNDKRLTFFIGDVRDRDRLYRAFQANVDIVVHAAALKQVPACEYNPFEAIRTNIIGAQNIIDAAIDCGVPKVLALSTDKAVNPVNLYGATKLCAERLFIQGNAYAGSKESRFSCVRYGNVVGSRGSVVPLFIKQREEGKVHITDERMTRFWITLEQGVELVVRSIETMTGGEVFVPYLPSMNIMDLAKVIAPDCDIEITGIRPGEKLHESLISKSESRHTIALENMFVVMPEYNSWGKVDTSIGKPLPEDYTYSSDTNDRWLTHEELKKMVDEQ